MFKDLIDKIVIIDNKTILEEIRESKILGYKYLYVISFISVDFGTSEGDCNSVLNSLQFYRGNHINEFSNLPSGKLFELDKIIIKQEVSKL